MEMLVAVALVLLMLTILSTIFGLATDTISAQRGIANNDQKARSLVTLIRRDFAKRTQRYPFPYFPTAASTFAPDAGSFSDREGYLYISTNNPSSFQDDLIQFTVNASIRSEDEDTTRYRGRATLLADLASNPNQPEADDALLAGNDVAESDAAEITYFMRNGSLYRRVILLRDPVEVLAQNLTDSQPRAGLLPSGPELFVADAVNGGGSFNGINDFWQAFDFAAVPTAYPFANHPSGVTFIGISELSNDPGTPPILQLGIPANRFGFNNVTGFSREHTDDSAARRFIGRYLQAETSHPDFNWPIDQSIDDINDATDAVGSLAVIHNGNPMDVNNYPVVLPAARDDLQSAADVVDQFKYRGRGHERRMEDLVLANVQEFKIEIWDGRVSRYVVPAHSGSFDEDLNRNGTLDPGEDIDFSTALNTIPGDYHVARQLNTNVGPGLTTAVFDTWHPDVDVDSDNSGTVDPDELDQMPPFMAYEYYPPRQNDTPPGPTPATAPAQVSDFTGTAVSYWLENTTYAAGDIVFARNATNALYAGWDANLTPINPALPFEWQVDSAAAAFAGAPLPDQGFQIAYLCTIGGTSSNVTPPTWPTTPGATVNDNGVEWTAFDNRRPLESVRLTVRFLDPPSGQIRQLSMILPMTDE